MRRNVRTLTLAVIVCTAASSATVSTVGAQPAALPDTDSYVPSDQWQYTEFSTQPVPSGDLWWQTFGSEPLLRLIALSQQNNFNVKSALSRIRSARAAMQELYAGYSPTISANLGYDIGQTSGRIRRPYSDPAKQSYFTLGVEASWEIDLFGRVAAQVKEGKAMLNVSRLDYDATLVSLAAETATQYFNLLMYRAALQNARDNIASQTEIEQMVEARYKAGLVSLFDLSQARCVLLRTQTQIPELEAEVATALNALTVLCGATAEDIETLVQDSQLQQLAPVCIDAGIPADLLRRRPDIVSAEMNLAALAARVGIAKKDFLPTLSLEAQAGVCGDNFGKMFHKQGFTYSVAPTLSWTIFDGLARRRNVTEARENLQASVADYNLAVEQAVADVNNAMARYISADSQLSLYEKVAEQERGTLTLALQRYKLGLTDFSDVSTSQQSLLSAQNSVIEARGAALIAAVTLYRALGGGWTPSAEE